MSYVRVNWEDGQTALSAEHLNNIEDGIEEAMQKAQGNNDMWTYIRDLVYPVGSIYMSATLSTKEDVEAALGGTWVPWGKGKVPVGVDPDDSMFNSAEKTGGSKHAVVVSHNHSFTGSSGAAGYHLHNLDNAHINYAGTHTHGMGNLWSDGAGYESAYTMAASRSAKYRYTDQEGNHTHEIWGGTGPVGDHTHTVSGTIGSSGESGTNKNLQPYITCYMWKRTA